MSNFTRFYEENAQQKNIEKKANKQKIIKNYIVFMLK